MYAAKYIEVMELDTNRNGLDRGLITAITMTATRTSENDSFKSSKAVDLHMSYTLKYITLTFAAKQQHKQPHLRFYGKIM